jgi:hypothetical protein
MWQVTDKLYNNAVSSTSVMWQVTDKLYNIMLYQVHPSCAAYTNLCIFNCSNGDDVLTGSMYTATV